jgi:phosphoadenosine phosphosulfate reductase
MDAPFAEFREVAAASSSRPRLSDFEIDRANAALADAEPQQILEWAVSNLDDLYQTTAFGLTGLAATDMLSKIFEARAMPGEPAQHKVPLIFIDTLYHFPETLALADQVSRRYGADLHVYTPPSVSTRKQFEEMYGQELWSKDEETYDYLVKVRRRLAGPPMC